ncbi:MAG: sigma-70 family RNA polymerase sigma factor [Myxococcales bacterium]|nr:sigma-70 family RNA polymerase sigma factor [Myxococcales bacterium]
MSQNEDIVEKLYRTYAFYIYRRSRSLLNSDQDAHDALHDVFVKLLENSARLSEPESLLPWLNRVTTNHCINMLRSRKFRAAASETELNHVPDTDTAMLQLLLVRQNLVTWLLSKVDSRLSECVTAYFFDEKSVDQIGNELGISVPTVRRRLKQFVQTAREVLHNEVIGTTTNTGDINNSINKLAARRSSD